MGRLDGEGLFDLGVGCGEQVSEDERREEEGEADVFKSRQRDVMPE